MRINGDVPVWRASARLCADPLPVWVIRRARHDHLAGRVTKLESGTYKVDVCRATDSLQGDAWAGAIVLLTQSRQGLRLRPLRRSAQVRGGRVARLYPLVNFNYSVFYSVLGQTYVFVLVFLY